MNRTGLCFGNTSKRNLRFTIPNRIKDNPAKPINLDFYQLINQTEPNRINLANQLIISNILGFCGSNQLIRFNSILLRLKPVPATTSSRRESPTSKPSKQPPPDAYPRKPTPTKQLSNKRSQPRSCSPDSSRQRTPSTHQPKNEA